MARNVRRPRTDADAARLTKLFKDALTWGKNIVTCSAEHDGLTCTRPDNHEDPPHAAAGKTLVIAVWED